ncbi:pyrophosphatase PpaX [Sinanaerobacter sp. ZZT-01]|uniref:pyrophosphatase PpaX n=1 Tax=Sinanaerobacter sp. ZZT-01 TaxID=3111540 RepID=UPI002D7945B1|nr:pyrophosphatase PpaX [Sinanaerobacter sp. ZZT-01]WRR94507.1 pyrophosphatase PpaX [Sinanaerobacter sp. ZZT-01]
MKKKTTVLFDFDGTIMDTNDIIIKSWQHTFQTLEGRERSLEEILETFGEPLRITMERVLPDFDTEKAIEIYRSYQFEHYRELIELFPGMKELIEGLKQKGYKLGVVTSRLRNSTEIGLKKYGLIGYFDTIVTADDTNKHKPDPEPIRIALEKLNSEPQETIMIGDSMFDVLCAQNAGVEAVLVSWAMATDAQSKLQDVKPEHVIEKAEELWTILR